MQRRMTAFKGARNPSRQGGVAAGPTVLVPRGWLGAREHRENEAVDFAIVGAGAGGATLAWQLARKGLSVVCFDAGPC